MLRKILFLTFMVPLFCSAQAELGRYQKKIIGNKILADKNDAGKYVVLTVEKNFEVSPYTAEGSAGEKRNLFDLSPEGQQAYIDAIRSKTNDAKSFVDKLPATLALKQGGGNSFELKKTEFLKRISLNIQDQNSPTQKGRIANIVVTVVLDNNTDIELTAFNNLSTKYQTTDFGLLSLTKVKTFTLNAGIELNGTGSTTTTQEDVTGGSTATNVLGGSSSNKSNLGASYVIGRTLAEQVALKNTIVSMRGSLGRNEAYILQNGVPNKNLDDRLDFELVFKAKSVYSVEFIKFMGLFDYKPGDSMDSKAEVLLNYLTVPTTLSTAAIHAKIYYTFVYREIYKGENTVTESDDKIIYYTLADRSKSDVKDIEFVKKDDFVARMYKITFKDNSGRSDEDLYLNYYGQQVKLLFEDKNEADELIKWLVESKKSKIRDFQFEYRKSSPSSPPFSYEKLDLNKSPIFQTELWKTN